MDHSSWPGIPLPPLQLLTIHYDEQPWGVAYLRHSPDWQRATGTPLHRLHRGLRRSPEGYATPQRATPLAQRDIVCSRLPAMCPLRFVSGVLYFLVQTFFCPFSEKLKGAKSQIRFLTMAFKINFFEPSAPKMPLRSPLTPVSKS